MIVLVSSLLVFILGCFIFMRPEKPLFAKMLTLAIGCAFCGRFYEIVRTMITGKDHMEGFQLGFLGIIGSIVFFFSINYGLLDKEIGGREKKNLKYRFIAMLAPAAIMAVYAFFTFGYDLKPINVVYGGVLTFVMALSSYYNLKHLILPDFGDGTLDSMRLYNLIALLYTFVCILEMNALITDDLMQNFICCVIISILILLFIPVSVRGNKKWKT